MNEFILLILLTRYNALAVHSVVFAHKAACEEARAAVLAAKPENLTLVLCTRKS